MKLYQYLIESGELDDIIVMLKRDCKPFLKESKGELLYRGAKKFAFSDPNTKYIKVKPRKDRKPMDTPKGIQDYFDMVMNTKYHWKPRSSGVFCSGSSAQASAYGLVCTVWPIGPFKYLWNPHVRDFYNDFVMNYTRGFEWEPEYETMDDIDNSLQLDLDSELKKYQNSGLASAIRSKKEIIIGCKEYYLIPLKWSEKLGRL